MKKSVKIKTGDTFISKSGAKVTVISYENALKVLVVNEFGVEFYAQAHALVTGRVTGSKRKFKNNSEIALFENEMYIKGLEGEYTVTTDGDVYSFKGGYRKKLNVGMNLGQRYESGSIGYLTVSLPGYPVTTVHRLVANTFIGPQAKGTHVDHKNGNKHDNRVANLRYVSPKDNVDAYYELQSSESRIKHKWFLDAFTDDAKASYSLGYLVDGLSRKKIKLMPEEVEERIGVSKEYLLLLPTKEVFEKELSSADLRENVVESVDYSKMFSILQKYI